MTLGNVRGRAAWIPLLCSLALMSGCFGDEGADPAAGQGKVSLSEVKGASLLASKTRTLVDGEPVTLDSKQALVVRVASADGDKLAAVDPVSGKASPVGIENSTDLVAGTDGTLAVVAADRLDEGRKKLVVRTSTDLKQWQEVEMEYPGRGWSVDGAHVVDGKPVITADDPEGGQSMLTLSGEKTVATPLPHTSGESEEGVTVFSRRGSVLLIRAVGREGGETTTKVWRSSDDGTTWKPIGRIDSRPGRVEIFDVVRWQGGLLASGQQRLDDGTYSAAYWTSTDGKTWSTFLSLPPGSERAEEYSWPSQPVVDGDRLLIDANCNGCDTINRWTLRPDGSAESRESTQIDANGMWSYPVRGKETRSVASTIGGLVRTDFTRVTTLYAAQEPTTVGAMFQVGEQRLVRADQFRFTRRSNGGWFSQNFTVPLVIADGRLRRSEWRPRGLSGLSSLKVVRDPESAWTVALGGEISTFDAQVFSGGKALKRRGSLGDAETEYIADLVPAEGEFVAALTVNQEYESPYQARLYSSRDGSHWNDDEGVWVQGGKKALAESSSYVQDLCTLPDGSALAVGESQARPDAPMQATSWVRKKRRYSSRWELHPLAGKGAGSSFASCAVVGEATVVSGTLNGRSQEWKTTDGITFEAQESLARGVERDGPLSIEGGLIASGEIDTEDYSGSVIWYSTEGSAWKWAPVASDRSNDLTLHQVGDRIYAVMEFDASSTIFTVDTWDGRKVVAEERS